MKYIKALHNQSNNQNVFLNNKYNPNSTDVLFPDSLQS